MSLNTDTTISTEQDDLANAVVAVNALRNKKPAKKTPVATKEIVKQELIDPPVWAIPSDLKGEQACDHIKPYLIDKFTELAGGLLEVALMLKECRDRCEEYEFKDWLEANSEALGGYSYSWACKLIKIANTPALVNRDPRDLPTDLNVLHTLACIDFDYPGKLEELIEKEMEGEGFASGAAKNCKSLSRTSAKHLRTRYPGKKIPKIPHNKSSFNGKKPIEVPIPDSKLKNLKHTVIREFIGVLQHQIEVLLAALQEEKAE